MMREIYKGLYVGDDSDYEKVKNDTSWFVVRACKDGPGGHRDTLHYVSMGAPKGKDYLHVLRGRTLAINLIDSDDPSFIPDAVIDPALEFIAKHLAENHKVLIACNKGVSRSPTIALIYLYASGKLPKEAHKALRMFRQIYPKYDPSAGLELYAKQRIKELKR